MRDILTGIGAALLISICIVFVLGCSDGAVNGQPPYKHATWDSIRDCWTVDMGGYGMTDIMIIQNPPLINMVGVYWTNYPCVGDIGPMPCRDMIYYGFGSVNECNDYFRKLISEWECLSNQYRGLQFMDFRYHLKEIRSWQAKGLYQ